MKSFPYLHIILFIVTFFSMLVAGTLQRGVNILEEPSRITEGLPFALSLMLILLSHELSHFFASKRHHARATLPYFIPAPSIIGTFGAFIKMKSPIITRKALIDIGSSGPIIGFVVSFFFVVAGLQFSSIVKVADTRGALGLGDSLLFSLLTHLVLGAPSASYDILLHPVAFAGWIGFFITSLNLLPIGQLDGGHIAYALLGKRHRVLSGILVAVLTLLGFFLWEGWLIWALLMLLLGLRHPPVIDADMPLDPLRKALGILSFIIFFVTFIPSPFEIL